MFDSIEFAQPILQKIDELLIQKKRLIIAVDGRCAAGKTTLAALIKDIYDCNVIQMDHFFPQSGQRTPERLGEPGGNVDYERVLDEVMGPLRRGGDFTYRPYDCQRMDFGDAVSVEENKINVVEGSYSCHPALFDCYDLRIFLTVGPEEQSRRILERNGPVRAEEFRDKWIPYEERYFSAFDIEKRCDYCVSMELEQGSAVMRIVETGAYEDEAPIGGKDEVNGEVGMIGEVGGADEVGGAAADEDDFNDAEDDEDDEDAEDAEDAEDDEDDEDAEDAEDDEDEDAEDDEDDEDEDEDEDDGDDYDDEGDDEETEETEDTEETEGIAVVEPGEELAGPQNLCVECNRRERDLSENASSMLCGVCRRDKIKLRIPPKIRVFLIVVSAIFLFSMIEFIPALSDFRDYLEAGRHMEAREYTFAYRKYAAVLEKYRFSVPLILKTADAAASAQYIGGLAVVIDNYLMDKNLTDSEYARAKAHINLLDLYYGTYSEVDKIFAEANETFTIDDDPVLSLWFVQERLTELLSKDGIDRTYIYFLLGNMSQDYEYAVTCFKYATESDPRFTYPYAYYGNALRRTWRMDQAREVYQKAIELNACDELAWRGLGVLDLLEGQKSRGLESIRYAYQIDRYTLYVADSLIIALVENGLRDEAMALLEEIVSEGFQVEEQLQAYLDGNLSLTEYYMG